MKRYALLAAIVFAGIVPFSSRAIYMDEHIFLKIAQSARENPLFPHDIPGMFFGIPLDNFAAHTHPPVGEYYLALIYSLLGRFSEVPFRLLFSVFAIAAVLAFYFLAKRFTAEPFLVALLLALSPAFFVMSPTLMMDIPMLAFLLAGIAFYFAHLDGTRYALPAAAVCFVLSAGTGYTMLVPLACLALTMLIGRRPWLELAAVAAAPLALVLWQIAMTIHFDELPITRTVAYFQSQGSVIGNIAATFSFVGGVAVFPLMTLLAAHRPRRATTLACAAVALVLGLVVSVPSPAARIWYMTLSAAGLILLASFAGAATNIMQTAKNRGEAFFILWVPATLLFFIFVADMINARYVLLALPALFLILFRQSDARKLTYTLVPTAILSVAIAYADFAFVNAYREWVREVVGPLQRQGFRLWSASESGLRFYLESAGMETLSARDERPRGTDLIVRHRFYRYALSEDTETMLTMLERFPLTSAFPLRTFNWEAGAGYHDSRVGIVPYTFSRLPYDEVEITQMSPFVATLPQIGVPGDEVPAWSTDGVILKQAVDAREFKMNIPDNCTIEYEVDGEGSVERTADGIILRRLSPGTIVWKRFRIIPSQFQDGK